MAQTWGRYELLQPLARGGMAEVFLARRRGPAGVEKRVVIKRIRPERAGDPRFLQLFVREARLSMSLAHENIVPVFDFGRIGDAFFLAMEHVAGRDLDAALARARARGSRIDPVVAAHLGVEACQALDYAHKKRDEAGKPLGVVHRDITPRNVLLSFSGEVKLVDFGVARLGADEERAGRLRGTPAYMAPEQARGETDVDARADLFSLGLVLWEALAGHRAYEGEDREDLLARARLGDVPALPDAVPAVLREIIVRATRRERQARFPDARTLQVALDGYIVSARAADPGSVAPSHRLAEWLATLFPEGEDLGAEGGPVQVPAGRVVTFLDDGEAQLVRNDGPPSSGGSGSGRGSMAETQAEDAPAPALRRRSRWPWAIAGLIVAGGAAFAFAVAGSRSATPPPEPRDPIAEPARAEPPPPDAAPPPPPPDAAVPPPPRPPTPPAPARRKLGKVRIETSPWSSVQVLGRKERCGETPCVFTLPEGHHTLRCTALDGRSKDVSVDIRADQTVEKKEQILDR